ncbi:MAG: hypothetical protein N4A57_08310 [Anaeromicrobium sp.]|nr:hypothetical protein [Anaeromicrobium sp.]MCT4594255.1 hypothetical protein [Anaeromicrobium sp.]
MSRSHKKSPIVKDSGQKQLEDMKKLFPRVLVTRNFLNPGI